MSNCVATAFPQSHTYAKEVAIGDESLLRISTIIVKDLPHLIFRGIALHLMDVDIHLQRIRKRREHLPRSQCLQRSLRVILIACSLLKNIPSLVHQSDKAQALHFYTQVAYHPLQRSPRCRQRSHRGRKTVWKEQIFALSLSTVRPSPSGMPS